MASKSAAEPAGQADARRRGRPGSAATAGPDNLVTGPDEVPGGAPDGALRVAPAGRGDWPEDPARLELRTTVPRSDLPAAVDAAAINGLQPAPAAGPLVEGLGPGMPTGVPADPAAAGSGTVGAASGNGAWPTGRLPGGGLPGGGLPGQAHPGVAADLEPAGEPAGAPDGPQPGVPGSGLGVGDEELITASGIPPEVASFLAASAAAAGIGLGDALRAAGVRSSRRSRTSPDRVQRSFYLSRDLVDRARAAVSATMRRPGEAYNVSQLAGRALENEVLRLERDYNDGKRFPPVTHVPSGPSPEGVERIRTGVTTPRRRRAT